MTRNTDTAFPGWTPPSYEVLPGGKVSDAKPGPVNNWGRWGDEDQIGTANLCTAERVAAAAALIRTGKRFSLALPIGRFPTPSGRPNPLHFFTSAASDAVLGDLSFAAQSEAIGTDSAVTYHISDDHVVLALQYTTQLDGFGMGIDHTLFNGYWAGLVTARSGARRLGMEKRAEGYVGRGVLLDVARHLGVERLDDEFRVGADLLAATADAQGVGVGSGDIVLVRTGYLGWWLQPGHRGDFHAGPAISAAAVPWLAERDVSLVAVDFFSIEVVSSTEPGMRPIEFHIRALRDLGLGVGETFDLDALADDCAADGVYEFFFAAMPLPVSGGCGSPLNPLVIK